jgi:hypothetical protein
LIRAFGCYNGIARNTGVPPDPAAFLSYSRTVDEHDVARFRDALRDGIREHYAGFELFFDRKDMRIGRWEETVKDELRKVNMLFVIVSPGLLESAPCRLEVETFLALEDARGKTKAALVPFSFVETPGLRDAANAGNPVAVAVTVNHRLEFQSVRHLPREDARYREAIIQAAKWISDQLRDDLRPVTRTAEAITAATLNAGAWSPPNKPDDAATAAASAEQVIDRDGSAGLEQADETAVNAQAAAAAKGGQSAEIGVEWRRWWIQISYRIIGVSAAILLLASVAIVWQRNHAQTKPPSVPAVRVAPLDKACTIGVITDGPVISTYQRPDSGAPRGPDLVQGRHVQLTGEIPGTDWVAAKIDSGPTFYFSKTACSR